MGFEPARRLLVVGVSPFDVPLQITANDPAVNARLSGEEGLLWLAAVNYSLQAEGRCDAARTIDELVHHLDPSSRTKEKWNQWYDLISGLIDEQPRYMKQLRTNLLFEFIFMVMRTAEDLVIVLKGLDPDTPVTEARQELHKDGSLGELGRFAAKDLEWYHRVLRLPKPTNLPADQSRALGRMCLSICREIQYIVKDVHELAAGHKYWLAYNSIKHGGQAMPEALGAEPEAGQPDWYPQIAPFGLVFYNWKDPVDTALHIPLGPVARRRYVGLLANLRLTIQLLLYQYQHTTPLGRDSCMPPPQFILTSAGFVAEDGPVVQALYDRFVGTPVHVDARPAPPTYNTAAIREWIAKQAAFDPMTDGAASAFMQAVSTQPQA